MILSSGKRMSIGLHRSTTYRSTTTLTPTLLGIKAFKDRIEAKPQTAVKTKICSSTHMSIDLATKLVGAAFGLEGEDVFPTLFKEANQTSWQPSEILLDKISQIIRQELSSDQDTVAATNLVNSESTELSNQRAQNAIYKFLSLMRGEVQQDPGQALLQQVTLAAGWPIANMWMQVSGVADVCMYSTDSLSRREKELFTSIQLHTITTTEIEQLVVLNSNVNKLTGPLEFKGPILSSAPLTACVAVLTPKSLNAENATFLDSQALLFCAATLINTAVATGCDAPRCGFSIVTDGRQWRFVALQLNTLDFNSALTVPGAVKNGAWVYEDELYNIRNGEVEINQQVLRILHNIITNQQ